MPGDEIPSEQSGPAADAVGGPGHPFEVGDYVADVRSRRVGRVRSISPHPLGRIYTVDWIGGHGGEFTRMAEADLRASPAAE
jgi:hypothetical protein